MFTKTEVQALLLGTQWVSQYADAPLSKGAKEALTKIIDVLPTNIKNSLHTFSLRAGPPASESLANEDLSALRDAISNQKKIDIVYQSKDNKKSQRIVWPFTIGYFTDGRILVAWCEKQKEYRYFKTNKIISLKILDEPYLRSRNSLFREWQKKELQKHAMKTK